MLTAAPARRKPSNRLIDISGQAFGNLVVVERVSDGKWRCRCGCGEYRIYNGPPLRAGTIKSCGCLQYNWSYTTEQKKYYHVWRGMKGRCYCPKNKDYPGYGGRGIKVCDRWKDDLAAFCADMDERPSSRHTLDRRDVNGDYEPSNCRWATRIEQSNNLRRNRMYEVDGELKTGSELYAKYSPSIALNTFKMRLRSGWPIKRAILPQAKAAGEAS